MSNDWTTNEFKNRFIRELMIMMMIMMRHMLPHRHGDRERVLQKIQINIHIKRFLLALDRSI